MSSLGYKSVKDQLVSILQGISSLKIVYGKEPKTITQFPAACVSAESDTEDFNSMGASGTNEVEIRHHIRVYFRTDEANDPDYEDILESTVDDIKQALRANITLNGVCEYATPAGGTWRNVEKEVPVRMYDMTTHASLHLRRDTGQLI
jgi:hypothetical protein